MTNAEFDSRKEFIKDTYDHAESIHDGFRYFTSENETEYFGEEMGGYVEILKLLNGEVWERRVQESGEWSEPECITYQFSWENDSYKFWFAIFVLMLSGWNLQKYEEYPSY